MILALIRPYLQPILAGAAVLGWLVAGVQTWRLNSATVEKVEAEKAELVCEVNTVTLKDAIEDQNTKTEDAAAVAEKTVEAKQKRAERVLKEKPAPHSPGADAMNKWLESNP